MRFLIFGDVMGRAGREALRAVLPKLRTEFSPDSVIINAENAAHGVGISPTSLDELMKLQPDVLTLGDHSWDNAQGVPLLDDNRFPLVRPANYPPNVSGKGYRVFTSGAWRIAVINLQGQVFMKNQPLNPFYYLDELLEKSDIKAAHIKLVDFHAEATSEKRGFGFYADGRISAVWGTHTHVPTADAQILPKGTGYISDLGMNGALHSIIGVEPAGPLKGFLQQMPFKRTPAENPPFEVNGLFLDIDPTTGKTVNIEHIRRILEGGESA
jgi:metallophosphoesterase (TIGR00282 family)